MRQLVGEYALLQATKSLSEKCMTGSETIPGAAPGKTLTPEAKRALEEAAARRSDAAPHQPEMGGPSGLEPTRYGDWERKGVAVDF